MTFNIQTRGIEAALNRIADALDRINPPLDIERYSSMKKRGPDAIVKYGEDHKQWAREQYSNLIHEGGLAPAREQELLDEMMTEVDGMDEEEIKAL